MKTKKVIIIIFSLILTALLFYVFAMRSNRKLPELSSYRIVSNTGRSIPAKLYSRTVDAKIGDKEVVVDELVLGFSDSLVSDKLNDFGEDQVFKFLVIVPELKMIGLVNHMQSLEEKDGYVCQSGDAANEFISMINNRTFFSDPPIKRASFNTDRITFNTYGVLKQYGDSVVVETGK